MDRDLEEPMNRDMDTAIDKAWEEFRIENKYLCNLDKLSFRNGYRCGYDQAHMDYHRARNVYTNQIDAGLKRESELATKLGKLQAVNEGLQEKLLIAVNALESFAGGGEFGSGSARQALDKIHHPELPITRVKRPSIPEDKWDAGEAWEEYRQNSIKEMP